MKPPATRMTLSLRGIRHAPGPAGAAALAWVSLALLSCCPGFATAAEPKAASESGRTLYMKVGCWQCHGTVGQGGAAGPRLAPGPMPLEALRAFLRNSVGRMPAYPDSILSDASIAAIHAYLASIPAAPRAESLPLLRELR